MNIFTDKMTVCLMIFAATVISFIWRKIPMAITAILSMVLYYLSGCIDAKTALSGFANTNTIMIASMFIVAAGFGKTRFIDSIASMVSRISSGSWKRAMAGYCLLTALLSQFIQSPSASFIIVSPIVLASCERMNISPSKVMFPIGLVAIATCGVLPIGASATNFATLNGYLQMFDYTRYQFRVWDIALARFPAMLFVMVYCIFFADKLAPDAPLLPLQPLAAREKAKAEPMDTFHEWSAIVIFCVVSISLLLSSRINLPQWAICMSGAILMVIVGVLKESEAYHAIPASMLVLYAGSLATGAALTSTGAGDWIGGALAQFGTLIGSTFIFYAIFFFVPFVLTQFMNNLALLNIFTPVSIMTAKALDVSPLGLCLLVQAAALCAFMTPMATATAPMIMGLGGYDMRSMLKQGLLPGLLIWLISSAWAVVAFPISL